MCNPPFYKDNDEIMTMSTAKKDSPGSICTGNQNEMITLGGEVAFIKRIINESLKLNDRIARYSSLVGIKSHLTELTLYLDSVGVDYAFQYLI